MTGEERRTLIISRLEKETVPISAARLAEEFSVTRQIIVADIALLRASGHSIRSEHRGYVLDVSSSDLSGILKCIVVKHGKDNVKDEFYAVVDNGGKILDVIVEHPIYGMISAKLNITTRYDADIFDAKISESHISPLSALTQGIHLHTIAVPDEDCFERIKKKLIALNIFIESD